MQAGNDVVRIEQTLEEPARFLFFTADDAMAFLGPLLIGFIARHLIPGAVVGLICYLAWARLKGEGGIARILAAVYWFVPSEVGPYRSWPRSDVSFWRG